MIGEAVWSSLVSTHDVQLSERLCDRSMGVHFKRIVRRDVSAPVRMREPALIHEQVHSEISGEIDPFE